MNKITIRLKIVKYIFLLLFLLTSLYILYFTLFQAKSISSNSFNRRLREYNSNIVRGNLLDRKNVLLVKSSKTKSNIIRNYLYSRHFSHIIGYWTRNLGSSGLEAMYNQELINNNSTLETLKSKASGEYLYGNNLKLTLDKDLQIYASSQLNGKKGAIVVLNPKTGEILALISKPDFNPSNIQENWDSITTDADSPLLNRATDGLYPPGSIFKIIDTSSIIKNNIQESIVCTGSVNIGGYEINDSGNEKHGDILLNQAFTKSCNSFFIKMGLKLGSENLFNESANFRFNKPISSDIKISQSTFPKKMNEQMLAQSSIGQGEVLITPIHAALIASTIANKGIMMQPYILDSIYSPSGKGIKKYKTKEIGRIIDESTAKTIKDLMVETVDKGTGSRAKINKVKVAGKTGTAENTHGNAHSWFIGFAPADNPRIAIAVLIENGGSGGKNAAPMAGKIIKKALSLIAE